MNETIIRMIEARREEIITSWMKAMDNIREEHRLSNIKDEMFTNTNRELVGLIFDHMATNEELSGKHYTQLIDRLQQMGMPLSYLTEALQTFRRLMLEACFEQLEDSEKAHHLYTEVDHWYDPILNQLVTASVKSWEDTALLQRNALKELSAPLIPVFEGISVMPLVGTIDTERAKQIMENLLEGTIAHRAQVVLIDITGVPVVDTMVAHHIIQAAEAVRLIGSKCILVGIRPEIAQTIVNLGIDLGSFPTKSSLKKGIQSGLEMTQRRIVDSSQEGSR